MDFNEFQDEAKKTAEAYRRQYLDSPSRIEYTALGLSGEAGEVANTVKKIRRDDDAMLTPQRFNEISEELGDVLWYAAMMAEEIGATLDLVARLNIQKLRARYGRGD